MPASLAQKLKIKEGYMLLTLGTPPNFKSMLGDLPGGVKLSAHAKSYNQIHWFVENKVQRAKEEEKVLALLKEGITLWTYFPKGSSGIQSDLTRDRGWGDLSTRSDLQWLSLISFNETWSTFALRLKPEANNKKSTKPKESPASAYINVVTKTVTLPPDLAEAFCHAPAEKEFFATLSFTNRKEYVEWVVSAKREETRKTRVNETIVRLGKKWKNPAGR